MKKSYYKLVDDAYYSHLKHYPKGLGIEPDGSLYFSNFKDAKKALRQILLSGLREWKEAYSSAIKLKPDSPEISVDDRFALDDEEIA